MISPLTRHKITINKKTMMCYGCRGKGYSDGGVIMCYGCHGTGGDRMGSLVKHPCMVCRGSGSIKHNRRNVCNICGGKGNINNGASRGYDAHGKGKKK